MLIHSVHNWASLTCNVVRDFINCENNVFLLSNVQRLSFFPIPMSKSLIERKKISKRCLQIWRYISFEICVFCFCYWGVISLNITFVSMFVLCLGKGKFDAKIISSIRIRLKWIRQEQNNVTTIWCIILSSLRMNDISPKFHWLNEC